MNMCKAKLATDVKNNGFKFPNVDNMTLLNHIPPRGTVINTRQNLCTYEYKVKRESINEQTKSHYDYQTLLVKT